MISVLKNEPHKYLIKQNLLDRYFPNKSTFDIVYINEYFVVDNPSSTSIIKGNLKIEGDLYLDNPVESENSKIENRYLYIFDPDEEEHISNQLPQSGQINGSNLVFTVQDVPIKENSLFIKIDEGEDNQHIVMDNGDGTLDDGGLVSYQTGTIELSQGSQPTTSITFSYVNIIDINTQNEEGLFLDKPTQGIVINRGTDNDWDKKILWDEHLTEGPFYFSFTHNDEESLEYVLFKFDKNSPLYSQFDDLFLSSVDDDIFEGNLTINQNLTVLGDTNFNSNMIVDHYVYLENYEGDYSLVIEEGDINVTHNLTVQENLYQDFIEVQDINVTNNITTTGEINVVDLVVQNSSVLNGPVLFNWNDETDKFEIEHKLSHFKRDVRIDGNLIVDGGLDLPDLFVFNTGDTVNGKLVLNKQGETLQLEVNDFSKFNDTQEFNDDNGNSTYQIDVNGNQRFNSDILVPSGLVEQSQGFEQGNNSDSIFWNQTINNNIDVYGSSLFRDTITIQQDILPNTNEQYDIGSSSQRINTVYQDVFDGKITNQIFQDVQENVYTNEFYEQGTICELKNGKLIKQNNPKQTKLYVISDKPQVHLQLDRKDSLPIQLQGSTKILLNNYEEFKIGDEIILDSNGIGKKSDGNVDNYIIGQLIEDNIVLLY